MSRTTRHAYDGQPIRDGQHGRRCPSAHCEWCSKGRSRKQKPQPEPTPDPTPEPAPDPDPEPAPEPAPEPTPDPENPEN